MSITASIIPTTFTNYQLFSMCKQPNRLKETQKVKLIKLASRDRTILDLCRLIGCKSYDVVWRFCTKHDLPYKMKWELRKEKEVKKCANVFDVDSLNKGYTWLV